MHLEWTNEWIFFCSKKYNILYIDTYYYHRRPMSRAYIYTFGRSGRSDYLITIRRQYYVIMIYVYNVYSIYRSRYYIYCCCRSHRTLPRYQDNRNIILNAFKFKHLTTYRKQGPLTEKKILHWVYIMYTTLYAEI